MIDSEQAAEKSKPVLIRWYLMIGDKCYVATRLKPDPKLAMDAIQLQKPDGTAYHVYRDVHGVACDCGQFIFRDEGRGGKCKHIRAVLELTSLCGE